MCSPVLDMPAFVSVSVEYMTLRAGIQMLTRAHLERQGTPIGPYDLQIAAHALSLGLTLVTNNTNEFERVPVVSIANWA